MASSSPSGGSAGILADNIEDATSVLSSTSAGSAPPGISAAAATKATEVTSREGTVEIADIEDDNSIGIGNDGENPGANPRANGKSLRHVGDDYSGKGTPDLPTSEVLTIAHDTTTGISPDVDQAQRAPSVFVTHGRFRRPHAQFPEESKAQVKARFWDGVKPARTNSTLLAPQGGVGVNSLTMATLRAAIKLKKRANVIQAKAILNKYILDPRSPRMRSWKNWMVVNIMYTVLVVPWQISFQSEAAGLGLALSGIANVSFIVDTVLHFYMAVETETGLLTDRKVIARRYLTSWFLLDAVTCLPVTTLLRNSVPASLRVLAPMRSLRLLTLLKVVKVYAMHYEVRDFVF